MSKQWEFRKDGFVYCKATGERVCSPHSTLPDSIKKFGPHKQDLKANARLIAAAPDLLEALKFTQYKLEQGRVWSGMEWKFSPIHSHFAGLIHDKINAAIAKAEGQE